MRTITIDLQDDAAEIMDRLMERRGYSSASDLMADVLRSAEPAITSRSALEALLLEGIDSEIEELTDADWDWVDREVKRQSVPTGR